MATTTPNYGWTVPTSTDLVKDGATAIETLGDAIDASMNTALGTKKAGMVLLNTTSFSAVATQSINSVFNSTYDNYLIKVNSAMSNNGVGMSLRVRASGTDLSGAVYKWSYFFNFSTGAAVQTNNADSATNFTIAGGVNDTGIWNIEMANPFATKNTHIQFRSGFINPTPAAYNFVGAGSVNNTTSYDGFTLIPDSGTITGTVSVYGYNK